MNSVDSGASQDQLATVPAFSINKNILLYIFGINDIKYIHEFLHSIKLIIIPFWGHHVIGQRVQFA